MGIDLGVDPDTGGLQRGQVYAGLKARRVQFLDQPLAGEVATGAFGVGAAAQPAHRAAAHNALSILSTLTATLGGLGGVKRLIKSLCMVNCAPGFGYHPEVMNGYR